MKIICAISVISQCARAPIYTFTALAPTSTVAGVVDPVLRRVDSSILDSSNGNWLDTQVSDKKTKISTPPHSLHNLLSEVSTEKFAEKEKTETKKGRDWIYEAIAPVLQYNTFK